MRLNLFTGLPASDSNCGSPILPCDVVTAEPLCRRQNLTDQFSPMGEPLGIDTSLLMVDAKFDELKVDEINTFKK